MVLSRKHKEYEWFDSLGKGMWPGTESNCRHEAVKVKIPSDHECQNLKNLNEIPKVHATERYGLLPEVGTIPEHF
jgi:hypothetical protein